MQFRTLGLAITTTLAASAAAAQPDPCLRCDILYASDCNTGLWAIDTTAGSLTFIGNMPTNMFDIAVSWDGRLFGLDNAGSLWSLSGCDGSGAPLGWMAGGTNALAGDLDTLGLYMAGPPLFLEGGTLTQPPAAIGGAFGTGPPDWCGGSDGDIAMNPADGLLYAALGCGPCGFVFGDRLARVDPATGLVVSEVGCAYDGVFTGFNGIYGLAFDSAGNLWASRGTGTMPLLRINPATGIGVEVGPAICAFGLASLPCAKPYVPCSAPGPPPLDVGDVLFVNQHNDPHAPDITAELSWSGDQGAPRPPGDHFHVRRSVNPRTLPPVPGIEPWSRVTYHDVTSAATVLPTCHYYLILAADACEGESRN